MWTWLRDGAAVIHGLYGDNVIRAEAVSMLVPGA